MTAVRWKRKNDGTWTRWHLVRDKSDARPICGRQMPDGDGKQYGRSDRATCLSCTDRRAWETMRATSSRQDV